MDPDRLDRFARSIATTRPRRRVLGLLASLPLVGGVAGGLDFDEAEARKKQRRRKHDKHDKRDRRHVGAEKKKKKKKKCKPQPTSTVCAGKCGTVTNAQTCNKAVDCGACTCSPACAVCFICQDQGPNAPGACVPDAAQEGQSCGGAGKICRPGGACTCVPDCAGKCGGADDGCGGTCEGCGALEICDGQTCEACDVCRSGDCTFMSVQEAINDPAELTTIRICPGRYAEFTGTGAAVRIREITRPLRLIGAGDGDNDETSTIITPSDPGNVVVNIVRSSPVILERLRITGANGYVGRGMIVQVCNVTLKDCTVADNHCGTGGGGILVFDTGSDVTLINTRVTGNWATRGGGIVADRFTTVTLDARSRVTGNTATDETVGYGGISADGSSKIYLPSPDNVTGNISGGSLANCGGGATFNGDGEICTSN